jgi:hypothetical protein
MVIKVKLQNENEPHMHKGKIYSTYSTSWDNTYLGIKIVLTIYN